MNEGLIPQRYAKALLKFAGENNSAERIYALSSNLAESFRLHPELDATVANPFVSAGDKMKVLTTAAGAEPADSVYNDFLKLLHQNNRLGLIRQIALSYENLYRKAHEIYKVDVESATPLSLSAEKRLKDIVSKAVGNGKTEYDFKVNPELIGGFTVKIGSRKLDASVKNELKRLSLSLLGN